MFTLCVFTFSSATSNASTAAPEPPANPRNIPTEIILPLKTTDSLEETLKKIPEDLGMIQEIQGTRSGKKNSDKPFVVHIQDAHSNPQAQSKIYKMLKYLNRKFPHLAIGVEGARGTLHPEYFDFFPDYPETGDAVIKDLHDKGEVTGAELFAWDEYKGYRQNPGHEMAPVFGVEDMELYRENLATYRALLFNRDEMDVALNVLRGQILKEQSKIVNPELRNFIRERERRKEGKFEAGSIKGESDFFAYLDFFAKQVKTVLQIDLLDPIEQLRFPNLVRIQLLKKAESEIDSVKSSAEWQKVLKLFRAKAESDQEKALIQSLDLYARKNKLLADASKQSKQDGGSEKDSLYPRRLLEKIIGFAQAKRINVNNEKNFLASFRLLVFRAEIEMPGLLKELEILENGIISNLARSEEEKKLVRQLENFGLFEKWLHIELSREELEKVLQRKSEMKDLFSLFLNSPENTQVMKLLETAAQKAEGFYATARKRDQVIVQNALVFERQANARRKNDEVLKNKQRSQISILVLITGGFHSEGITEELKGSGLGYAVISPRMNEFDNGELYQQVMADQHADLSLYFKNGNPFQSKQQAILFKQAIEIAVPLLVKGYQVPTQQVPGMIKEAMDTHPLLSQVLAVNLIGQNQQTIRFSPKASEMISPQSAAIVRELLANSDGVLLPAGPRITFNVEVNQSGRAELKVVAAREVRLTGNRAELRARSGALTADQLARRSRTRQEAVEQQARWADEQARRQQMVPAAKPGEFVFRFQKRPIDGYVVLMPVDSKNGIPMMLDLSAEFAEDVAGQIEQWFAKYQEFNPETTVRNWDLAEPAWTGVIGRFGDGAPREHSFYLVWNLDQKRFEITEKAPVPNYERRNEFPKVEVSEIKLSSAGSIDSRLPAALNVLRVNKVRLVKISFSEKTADVVSTESAPTGAQLMKERQRAELRFAEFEASPLQRLIAEAVQNLPATAVLSQQFLKEDTGIESRAPLYLVRTARDLGWIFSPHLAASDPRLAGALRTYIQARSSNVNPSIQEMDLEAYQAVVRAFSGTGLLRNGAETTNLVVLTSISDLDGGAEAHSYFFIPILLGGSVQILVDQADTIQIQDLQAQFRAYAAKLKIPEKLAARLMIEIQTPSTGAQRRSVEKFFSVRPGARGLIGAEADVTRFGFDGKTVRAYRSEVRMDAAVVVAPSLIRELVAQILHVPQSIDTWMRTKGFDSDSISARIAVVMESFRKIAQAA